MAIYHKLTNGNNQTYNGTQWGPDVTHRTRGEGELCTLGWIHFYEFWPLGLFLNPVQGNFTKPNLWTVEADIKIRDGVLKAGSDVVTTLEQLSMPEVSTEQIVYFAITCALSVGQGEFFVQWAEDWISNKDRSAAHAARAGSHAARTSSHAGRAGSYATRTSYAAIANATALCAARTADYAAIANATNYEDDTLPQLAIQALNWKG